MSFEEFSRVPINCGVWKKLKPVNSDKWLRTLLHNYLDEETKIRGIDWAETGAETTDEAHKKMLVEGKAPLRPDKDYAPLSSGIWTFGHVASRLSLKGVSPAQAQPPEVIKTLGDWWVSDRKDNAIKAHHIVASFDPRIAVELNRRGYPVDAMLLSSFHQTLSQFGARYYPNSTLGWIAGCHHDRANPHVHALLHPTDSNGKLLRVSGLKDGEQGEDKFQFLHKSFNTRARQLFVGLTLPREVTKTQQDLSLNQWLLLSRQAMLHAGPGSVDAPYAASDLLKRWLESRNYPEILEESSRETMAAYQLATPVSPDPVALGKRWSEIIDEWHVKTVKHTQTALDTFETVWHVKTEKPEPTPQTYFGDAWEVKKGKSDKPQLVPAYAPVTSPATIPTPPSIDEYIELAGAGQARNPRDLNEAMQARRAQSERQRLAFNQALKRYRASIEQSRRDMDAITVQAGFAVAQIEMQAAVLTGKKPKFLEFSEPGKPVPRMLPTDARSEVFAEREMASLANVEAGYHQPEDPEALPSMLASSYSPKFRELCAPSRNLTDQSPTL